MEYLVTGQGYLKADADKQTILLHHSCDANNEDEARQEFIKTFEKDNKILSIYSIVNLSQDATI